MIEAEEVRSHLAEHCGFRAHMLYSFDHDVVLPRRDNGSNWVARVFGPERPRAAVQGDAAVLSRLHTLPLAEGARRAGGGWHPIVNGSPRDELTAAAEWLAAAEAEAAAREVAHFRRARRRSCLNADRGGGPAPG